MSQWGTVIMIGLLALPPAAAVTFALARVRRATGHSMPLRSAACDIGIVVSTAPWLWMILTPLPRDAGLHLVPFVDLADLATAPPWTIATQLIGNLLVFAGLGFLLPIRSRRFAGRLGAGVPRSGVIRSGVVRIGAVAAAGSILVEVCQYAFDIGRVSSIDDVLLNTAGAMLAALLSRRWWAGRRPYLGDALPQPAPPDATNSTA